MVLLLDETLTAIDAPAADKIATMVGAGKQGSSKNEEERESIFEKPHKRTRKCMKEHERTLRYMLDKRYMNTFIFYRIMNT